MRKIKVNLGDKKTKCKSCGLWTPAGKRCMWCNSDLPTQARYKVRCQRCSKVSWITRSEIGKPMKCHHCGRRITPVRP